MCVSVCTSGLCEEARGCSDDKEGTKWLLALAVAKELLHGTRTAGGTWELGFYGLNLVSFLSVGLGLSAGTMGGKFLVRVVMPCVL